MRTARLRGSTAALLARTGRADAALLVLSAVVVALACLLSIVVPRVQTHAAQASVRAAAAEPGAIITASVALAGDDDVPPKQLWVATADTLQYVADKVAAALPVAYRPPVATLVSRPLTAERVDHVATQMRLAFLTGQDAPQVTWVQGREPGATAQAADIVGRDVPTPPVEVGLTGATAQLLGVSVGDEIDLLGPDGTAVTVTVSGLFAPRDGADWAWQLVPSILEPLMVGGGDPRNAVVGLLSADSVPFARYALPAQSFEARYDARPDADTLTLASAGELARAVRALTATPNALDIPGVASSITTRADAVLDRSIDLSTAAATRAMVVLLGLLVATGALLALAAAALAGRRRTVLALLRERGAARPILAGATTVESVLVALVGAGAGVGVAVLASWVVPSAAGPGGIGRAWLVPAVAAALLPAIAVLVAVSATESRAGARAGARMWWARQAGRAALELVVVTLAVLATVALRNREAAGATGTVSADLVVLAAAPLIAGTGVVGVLRVAPWLHRAAIAVARRGSGAVVLLAAVRAGVGPVGTVTIVMSVAMGVFTTVATPLTATPLPPEAEGPTGEAAGDPVLAPLVQAADLTRTLVTGALIAIAIVAVVLLGVAERTRRDSENARARALGMPATRTRGVAVLAAAVPVALVATAGVGAGVAAMVLLVPEADVGAMGLWWISGPVLALLAAGIAWARPARESLASRLRTR